MVSLKAIARAFKPPLVNAAEDAHEELEKVIREICERPEYGERAVALAPYLTPEARDELLDMCTTTQEANQRFKEVRAERQATRKASMGSVPPAHLVENFRAECQELLALAQAVLGGIDAIHAFCSTHEQLVNKE